MRPVMSKSARTLLSVSFLGPIALGMATSTALAESRSYAVSWFAGATNSTDGDCSGGVHPGIEDIYLRYARELGVSSEQITTWRKKQLQGEDPRELYEIVRARGRIDGKPVNPYAHPASVVDLKLPGLDGAQAFGFDLDGKSDDDDFEDPETHQKGVDHQLYRALGCARAYRGALEGQARPTYWLWAWEQLRNSQPAWIVTINGTDLSKDGPVTVVFNRALEHLRFNSNGSARHDMAYRNDPDPRSHNSFRGEIRNGTVRVTEHGNLRLLQNPLGAPELRLSNFNFRLTLKADRTARGFMGGYQPWEAVYWSMANLGPGGETQITGDIPAFYHLLKRYADADPDPSTGQNRAISATYFIEAVPAFTAASASGQELATIEGEE